VPLPFQCVYVVQVADYHQVEKLLHDAFADTRARSSREFFEIDEQRVISALMLASGKDVTPGKDVTEDVESSRALKTANERRRRAPVAQLDRALPSEGRGQRFESSRVRQSFQWLKAPEAY
jgi:hypothetical protein